MDKMGRGAARGSRRRKSGGSPLRPVPAGRRFPLGLWLGETGVERALLVGPIFVVLIVELLNSAVEAAIAVLVCHHGVVPPTINYETPDPDCDLDYVPNVARTTAVRRAMSTSVGLGGHNSAIIFGRWDDA